jgi:hypothetical protein
VPAGIAFRKRNYGLEVEVSHTWGWCTCQRCSLGAERLLPRILRLRSLDILVHWLRRGWVTGFACLHVGGGWCIQHYVLIPFRHCGDGRSVIFSCFVAFVFYAVQFWSSFSENGNPIPPSGLWNTVALISSDILFPVENVHLLIPHKHQGKYNFVMMSQWSLPL